MKDKLLIIGASGHGKVVADIALKMNKWNTISFLDDDDNLKTLLGLEVIGKSADAFHKIEEYDIFVGIGNNPIRKKIQTSLEGKGVKPPILIHPSAIIGEQVNLSSGTVVMAGVVINCCTSVGRGCIINTGATIDHDSSIEDFVHISPGAHLAGTVSVGQGSWLGVGATVIQGINIGKNSVIGAGAVVLKNIPASCTAVGAPAKPIKFHE